jgi:hypothetical protein
MLDSICLFEGMCHWPTSILERLGDMTRLRRTIASERRSIERAFALLSLVRNRLHYCRHLFPLESDEIFGKNREFIQGKGSRSFSDSPSSHPLSRTDGTRNLGKKIIVNPSLSLPFTRVSAPQLTRVRLLDEMQAIASAFEAENATASARVANH